MSGYPPWAGLLDWDRALSLAEETEADWAARPFLEAGTLSSVYADPKDGKSLFWQLLARDLALTGGALGTPATGEPGPVLYLDYENTESTPKTKTGDRLIWLDAETVRILKEHRKAQLKTRLKAGESWQDNDLIFCQDDRTPIKPDAVTRRFKRLASLAGPPVIRLHEGRHSAASLARDAEVDPEIRRKTLGHADAAMTAHYTHIEAEAHKAAAEAVAKLVEGAGA